MYDCDRPSQHQNKIFMAMASKTAKKYNKQALPALSKESA